MDRLATFGDVISQWPSAAELARELGLEPLTVRAWRQRESIPPEHWKSVEAAASKRGFDTVTVDLLAEISARKGGRLQGSDQESAPA